MNFHTFELSYKLSTDDVRIVYNELYNYKPKDDCAVFNALQDYGIIIFIKKYKQDEYNHHVLYYRINPRRVLENHNYIGIFNSKNIDKLIKKFNILIKTVSPFLPEFDSCNISRIDYCSNVELNDQAVIDSYINLLKRGYFPSKYTIKKYKNEKSKRNTLSKNGISYVEAGSIDQPICDRRGDLICADWGYAYLASTNGSGKSVSLGDYYGMKESFVKNGTLATTKTKWTTRKEEDNPAMAYVHNLGSVSNSGKEGFMMLGYDDIYSIEYMYEKRMGYWKHDGKVTIFDAFEKLRDNYQAIMERCRAFDELIYDDAEKAGG